jgi:2-polyprenyl-3-methyl-5-hydroxy-6-metoxy-1,4-benzoquinol methylase
MKEINQCPITGAKQVISSLETQDYFGNGEHFTIKFFDSQIGVTSPQPDADEILNYYKSNSYVSHGASRGFFFDTVYALLRRLNLRHKFRLIPSGKKSIKLLDYGCGTGAFLAYARNKGVQVTGLEPDQDARAHIAADINTYHSLDELPTETYDVITLYHVLEHVHDPNALLRELTKRLKPNGQLHIALPNYGAFEATHYQQYWAAYDVPRHLYHFNKQAVEQLCHINQLKLVNIEKLSFDSYYVSLLSEQYKKSKFAALRATWYGFISNMKARNKQNYSSLIYIISS